MNEESEVMEKNGANPTVREKWIAGIAGANLALGRFQSVH